MGERISSTPQAQRNLDHYYSVDRDSAKRQEFIDRDLIPTNNLCMYCYDSSRQDLMPGKPNPYDYRTRPFASVFESLQYGQPELWAQAQDAGSKAASTMKKYWDGLQSGSSREELAQLEAAADEAFWEKQEVFTTIYLQLIPQLEALGIDPLDVCM